MERKARTKRASRIATGAMVAISCALGAALPAGAYTLQQDNDLEPVVLAEGDSNEQALVGLSRSTPSPTVTDPTQSPTSSPTSTPVSGAGVQWPLASKDSRITDNFGPRVAPCSGCSSNHRGVDFGGAQGEKIGSIAAGTVVDVSNGSGGLGTHVVVEHLIDNQKVTSAYGHMVAGSIAVKIGDKVKVGQLLGLLGSTGASTGPHLHLEILIAGSHIDPLKFLQKYVDGKQVDIFGEPPVWSPVTNPDDEGEGWTPERSETYVPPAEAVTPTVTPAPSPTDPTNTNTGSPTPVVTPTNPVPTDGGGASTPPSTEPTPTETVDPTTPESSPEAPTVTDPPVETSEAPTSEPTVDSTTAPE